MTPKCLISRPTLIIAPATIALVSMLGQRAFSQGPMDFALVIGPDATVSIRTLANQEHLVDAYHFIFPSSLASPDDWNSINEKYLADPESITSVFGTLIGQNILGSGVITHTDTTQVFEFATLQWPPSFTWPIGKPLGTDVEAIRNAAEQGEIDWFINYCELCAGELPIIFEIPEPATYVLLLCGLPALLMLARWRRRASFKWKRSAVENNDAVTERPDAGGSL